jgi:hypothetical protein
MDRLALEKFPLQQAVDQKEQVHAKPFFNLQETRRKFAPMSLVYLFAINYVIKSNKNAFHICF